MASDVIKLSDWRHSEWKEIFTREDGYTTLHVYADARTGEMEIFQMSDTGGGGRTCLSKVDALAMIEALKLAFEKPTNT